MQDVDGLLEGRLIDVDRLEAALQGGVLLDVLAVLVEGGRPDALDLAARERRLEDVGGVDRALGGTRPDQGVELVDEEDDLPGLADLVEDLLEPLLELAPVLGAGHQPAHVQGEHALAHQRLGDVAQHDGLGQPLGDGGLADAGLADEGGIVLCPAGEDLDHPLDLHGPADDRVELVLLGQLGEVAAELIQQRGLARLLLGLLGVLFESRLVEQALDLAAHLLQVGAEVLEHVGRDALALDEQAEQEVLGAHVVVAHPPGLLEGDLDDLLDPGGGNDLLDDDPLVAAEHGLDGAAHLVDLDAQVVEDLGGQPLTFAQQAEQEVLRTYVRMVRALGLLLGEGEDLLRSLSEPLKGIQDSLRAPPGPPTWEEEASSGHAPTLPIMPIEGAGHSPNGHLGGRRAEVVIPGSARGPGTAGFPTGAAPGVGDPPGPRGSPRARRVAADAGRPAGRYASGSVSPAVSAGADGTGSGAGSS